MSLWARFSVLLPIQTSQTDVKWTPLLFKCCIYQSMWIYFQWFVSTYIKRLFLVNFRASSLYDDSLIPQNEQLNKHLLSIISQEVLPWAEQIILGGVGACREVDTWSRRDHCQCKRPAWPQVSSINPNINMLYKIFTWCHENMGLLFKLPLLSKDFIFYFLCTGLSSEFYSYPTVLCLISELL